MLIVPKSKLVQKLALRIPHWILPLGRIRDVRIGRWIGMGIYCFDKAPMEFWVEGRIVLFGWRILRQKSS